MSYAVVWSENGGPASAGRLELAPDAVRLIGSLALRLGLADLKSVRIERGRGANRQRPVLVLIDRRGTSIELWSLEGLGALHELADELLDAQAKAAA